MIKLEINTADKMWFVMMKTRFPREMYRAVGRAGATMRSRMRKTMKGGGGSSGVPVFPSLASETLAIHAARGKANKIGGKLSESSAIQMYRDSKHSFVVGFVSGLEPFASAFQTPENRATTTGEKIFARRCGVRNFDRYGRPKRDVLDSFTTEHQKLFPEWIKGNLEKILAKKR